MNCPTCNTRNHSNARFCGNCGTALNQAASRQPPAASHHRPAASRRIPLWLIGLLGGLVVLVLVAIAAFLLLSTLLDGLAGSGQILYTVVDGGILDTIGLMEPDGTNTTELVRERNSIWLPTSDAFLSPDTQRLIYYEHTNNSWELVLISTQETGAPLLVEDRAIRPGGLTLHGFSPDSNYFAYTSTDDDDDITLHVVDKNGVEVLNLPDLVFADFFPDNNHVLVLETDEDGLFRAISRVDLATQTVTFITDLADSSGWVHPLVAPDGNHIYFQSDDELFIMPLAGGSPQHVHRFDSFNSTVLYTPDEAFLVLLDRPENESLADLYLLNLNEDTQPQRLDSDVIPNSRTLFQYSSDQSLIAYTIRDNDELSLYVTRTDGSDRQRISDDNSWLDFAFSPDGRQIVYLEGDSFGEGGTLYIANTDGSERIRLDVDVWSFVWAGNRIVYSKVQDLDQDDPESEIFRIRPSGEDQELLRPAENGLIMLRAILD